jgi:D-amino-acid dehydrogenase
MRAANAAHVARSAPLLRDLNLASRALFEEWDAELELGLVKRGLIMLCRTKHGLEEETRTAAMANDLGVPAELLSCEDIGRLEPALRCAVEGGVYYPRDCHLDPQKLVAVLARAVEDLGVRIEWSTSPARWGVAGERVKFIETNRGTVEGDEFVMTAGVWSAKLAAQLGIELPMQAGRGYSLTLQSPHHLPELCAILTEARVAVTPMGGALRFGGTMEIIGTPESDLPPVNPARVRGITRAVTQYLPEFTHEDFRDVPVWSGLRPCSPDGMPYIGRFARYSNLSAATGHAMMGVSLAPVTGKLMAEILSDEQPHAAITALRPDRYDGKARN